MDIEQKAKISHEQEQKVAQQHDQLKNELAHLQTTVEEDRDDKAQLEASLRSLGAQLEKSELALNASLARMESLERQQSESQTHYQQAQRLYEDQANEIAALRLQLDASRQQLEAAKHKSRHHEAHVSQLESRVEEEAGRCASLTSQNAHLTHERDDLTRQLASYKVQFEALEQSTSWRITKPLRSVKTMMGGKSDKGKP